MWEKNLPLPIFHFILFNLFLLIYYVRHFAKSSFHTEYSRWMKREECTHFIFGSEFSSEPSLFFLENQWHHYVLRPQFELFHPILICTRRLVWDCNALKGEKGVTIHQRLINLQELAKLCRNLSQRFGIWTLTCKQMWWFDQIWKDLHVIVKSSAEQHPHTTLLLTITAEALWNITCLQTFTYTYLTSSHHTPPHKEKIPAPPLLSSAIA